MPALVKFAIVSNRSDFWGEQYDRRSDGEEALVRHGTKDFHIERWTYHEQSDGTHSEPVKERLPVTEPRRLICACCGSGAMGRQWWNRDTGYGYCGKCNEENSAEEIRSCYGVRGYHFSIEGAVP